MILIMCISYMEIIVMIEFYFWMKVYIVYIVRWREKLAEMFLRTKNLVEELIFLVETGPLDRVSI